MLDQGVSVRILPESTVGHQHQERPAAAVKSAERSPTDADPAPRT